MKQKSPPEFDWSFDDDSNSYFARSGEFEVLVWHEHNYPRITHQWRVKLVRHRGVNLLTVMDGHARRLTAAKELAAEFLSECEQAANHEAWAAKRVMD